MNNARRINLSKALNYLKQALEVLEDEKGEEENAFYSMPENLQSSEKGQLMEANIEYLDSAFSDVESAIENIELATNER
jgi:hypothetical protein